MPADAAGNPILAAGTIRPESVQHFEAGIKTQFLDRRATLNMAAFRTTIDDFQANVSNGQFGVLRGYLANADRVRTQGIEVDFSVRPSDRITAYANSAYTDAKYVKFVDAPCRPTRRRYRCRSGQSPACPGYRLAQPDQLRRPRSGAPGVSKWSFSYGAEVNQPGGLFGRRVILTSVQTATPLGLLIESGASV